MAVDRSVESPRATSLARVAALTALAMVAFACNSLLCRLALRSAGMEPASFTAVRLVAGAVVLWLLVKGWRTGATRAGDWSSALALFAYAAAFSFAYVDLPASTGALLLFGAVQATMIGGGLWSGERLHGWQLPGLALALGGLVGLLAPGLTAPPVVGSVLMLAAGVAWGVYSLRGKARSSATRRADPIESTAGNFLRTVPFALLLGVIALLPGRGMGDAMSGSSTGLGIACAIASGALASGLGYAVWYTALPSLRATTAATVQLSVPVLTALGGVALLGEAVTVRLVLASLAILGGIALVILAVPRR
jgi:drug/metabolite transporter (DMT)-like permease